MRDHLVDLRVADITASPDELEQHRAAMMQALGPTFVATCETTLSSSEIACATAASDLPAASTCTAPAQ